MIQLEEIQSRPKISVYIATSIDGYIARKDHGLDWLEKITILLLTTRMKIMGSKIF